ncbi:MAG: methyl-accepting chemotaxis protein [Burkholderiaceae bacterium]
MKTNLPITQKEHPFPAGKTLMSTTDPSSHVTYANGAFQAISGFERDELLGQTHNIVRHPDMPPAAFADMWATLKLGRTWTGLVKNRRKNGDHYWVRANVTPMRRHGQTVGYMSVRTKPEVAEIEAIEAVYARMRDDARNPWALRQGLLYRKGLLGLAGRARFIGLGTRIAASLAIAAVPGLAVALSLAESTSAAVFDAAMVATGALLGFALLHWQVVRPTRRAVEAVRAVASCEPFDIGLVDRGDEFGELLRGINQSGLNLASLLDDVDGQIEGLKQASKEVSSSSGDLASRTERAAANLEQSATAMEQFAATVATNTRTAAAADEFAAQASEVARESGTAITSVITQMRKIEDASERIAAIISVIDGIAFQTNILALNAAVEAARAGDQGRGFAVVAAEVRTLAKRSADAAKDISALITQSTAAVHGGSALVDEAGRTITDVVGKVGEVNQRIADLAQAAQEQADTIAQVSVALHDLDVMTQENAALVEESSAASESLHRQSVALADAVRAFRGAGKR